MLNYEITQEQWINVHRRDGKIEAAKEFAIKLLKRCRPLNEIIEVTGLEEKVIKELAMQNNLKIEE